MSDQWPDPNGKWMRRVRKWMLPTGLVYLVFIGLVVAGKVLGWSWGGEISWITIVLDGVLALGLTAYGFVLRRGSRQH